MLNTNINQFSCSNETDDKKITSIKNKINNILQGNQINKNDINQLLTDLKEKELLSYFFLYLNLKRCDGKFHLTSESFIQLREIFEFIMINLINIEEHYDVIRHCLILSQTYYYLNGKEKIYVSDSFGNIEMFKHKEFWEYYFAQSLCKEMKELWNMKNMSNKHRNRQKKNIVFSKIMTLVHNMMEVKVQKKVIEDIANVLCKQYVLGEKMDTQIMMVVDSYKCEDNNVKELCLEKDSKK